MLWLATVAFLPVLAPRRLLLTIVVALPVLAAQDSYLHSAYFHHGAVMVPFLVWAAVGGAQRWKEITGKEVHAFVLPVAAVSLLVLYGPVAAGNFERSRVSRQDGEAALARLDPSDRLLAQSDVRDRAGERDMALLFPYPFGADCSAAPRVAGERNIALWPANAVDTVVVAKPRTDAERAELDALVKSRCFADLGQPERVGDLLLYRRSS